LFNDFSQTELIDELVLDNCTLPTDIIIDTWTQTSKLPHKSYQIVPHLFQHVGAFSSNREKNQGDHVNMKTSSQFDNSNEI